MRRLLLLLLLAFPLTSSVAVADETVFRALPDGGFTSIEQRHQPGQWLLVMVWASDCEVCNREVHAYSDFHLMHADDDARVLGVSVDGWGSRDAASKFITDHDVQFDNLVAEPGDFARFYRQRTGTSFSGTPTFLVYDPQGHLAAKQVGAVPVAMIEEFINR